MTEFNLGQSFGQGVAIGNAVQQTRQKNALADIYSQHGAGIAAGDPTAMNALAGLDPMQAYKLQRQRDADARTQAAHDFDLSSGQERLSMAREKHGAGMKIDQARLDQIGREAEAAMRQHAAQMSEAERAAEAQQTQAALARGKAAFIQGEAAIAEWVQQYGAELAEAGVAPEAVTVDNFPAILKTVQGFNTALSGGQVDLSGMVPEPPEPQSSAGKFYADQQAGLLPPDAQYKGGGVTVNNNTATETAFDKETGKLIAQEAAAIAAQGDNAQRNKGQLSRLEAAIAAAPEGADAAILKFAGDMGIKTKGSANLEVMDALISQMVPQQRPPGSGTMSDADLALFKRSLPSLMNTQNGNRQIIDTIRAIADYDIQRGEIARRLQYGQITPQEAAQAYSELGNPLSDMVQIERPDPSAANWSETVLPDGTRYRVQRID